MGNVRNNKDLDVWREGIKLVTKVYALVQDFPKEEKLGLVDQIKRASVSIPSNIAEGVARNSQKEVYSLFAYRIRFSIRAGDTVNHSK
jgi:hypothetical protein